MIARFTDLNERLVVNKNTSLKDFVNSTFSKDALRYYDGPYLKKIINKKYGVSFNLTDGKPGDWCIMRKDYDTSSLWVSYCDRTSGKEVYAAWNCVAVFDFGKDKEHLSRSSMFVFQTTTIVGSQEGKNAAAFARKIMHAPQVLSGDYAAAKKLMAIEDKRYHSWE